MRKAFYTVVCTVLFSICAHAQSITPFTLNIGGFSASKGGYSLTISTGETISITDFKAPNGVGLSSGFLQNNPPLVTGIDELNTSFGPNEIKITPNPVKDKTLLIANIQGVGQLQYQLFDLASKLLYRSQAITVYGNVQNPIDFTKYATGQYYVQVVFKPLKGKARAGIYKIVKL